MNKSNLMHLRDKFLLTSDWHIHTNYVHGKHTIPECVKKGEENGLKLIVIVEHVRQNLTYDFSELLEEIDMTKKESKIKLLSGAEAKVKDINGSLDMSSKVKKKVDVVYGAFHSWFKQTTPAKEEYLEALLNMIKRKEIDIWAHPFLLPTRYGIHFEDNEILEIVKTIKKYEIFVEINLRYKLPPTNFLNTIFKVSIPFVISSDAHSKYEIWDKSKPDFFSSEVWQKIKNGE